MEEILVRKCCKCKLEKPLHEFPKNKSKYLGISNVCKQCNNIYSRAYSKSDKYKNSNSRLKRIKYGKLWNIKHKEHELWRAAKTRAKNKNIEFSIEEIDIIIPSVCPILGIPIFKDKGKSDNSPSLDRIDNTKGYTKDNICVISWRANSIKHVGTAEEHRKIYEYMKRNNVE